MSGGGLAGLSSCTVQVDVTGPAAGSYTNTIPAGRWWHHALGETVKNAQPAADTLVVKSTVLRR